MTNSLDYLRGILKFEPEKSNKTKEKRLLHILRKRNELIRKLHAYYKYSIDDLAAVFRMSRSGIHYILTSREEFGDYKPCETCKTIMWQGNLDWAKWQRKRYCSRYCKEKG